MKVERIKSRRTSAADEVAAALQKRDRRTKPRPAQSPPNGDGVRFDVLGRLVRQKRSAEGLSLRDAERLTGVSASTLSRLENGKTVEVDKVFSLTHWLNVSVEDVFGAAPQDVPQTIKSILLADPKLTKDESDALCGTFLVLYRQITSGRG